MARLQRALIFGPAVAVAMLFIGFGLASAEPWMHYVAGTLCLLVAAYRIAEPDLHPTGLAHARRTGR